MIFPNDFTQKGGGKSWLGKFEILPSPFPQAPFLRWAEGWLSGWIEVLGRVRERQSGSYVQGFKVI